MGQIRLKPVSRSKVLLKHNHIYLFVYCVWLFCATVEELRNVD